MTDHVITRDDSKSFLQIQVYADKKVKHVKYNMTSADRVTVDQPTNVMRKMRETLQASLPVTLRGNKLPPTMDALRLRANGMIAAGGASRDDPGSGLAPDEDFNDEDDIFEDVGEQR